MRWLWGKQHGRKPNRAKNSPVAPVRYLDILHPPIQSPLSKRLQQLKTYLLSPRSKSTPRSSKRKGAIKVPIASSSLQLHLPARLAGLTPTAFTKLLARTPRLHLLVAGLSILLISTAGGYHLITRNPAGSLATDTSSGAPVIAQEGLPRGTPDYTTLAPAGKDIERDLGGWARVSPEGRDPVYAYVDQIGEITMAVSQQPLPDEFQYDTATHVDRLAREFGATEKITVQDTTVHIGSTSDGPQSLIFYRDNLLVLIKSADKVPNDKWSAYIASLR